LRATPLRIWSTVCAGGFINHRPKRGIFADFLRTFVQFLTFFCSFWRFLDALFFELAHLVEITPHRHYLAVRLFVEI
jgi:hypothetical protein